MRQLLVISSDRYPHFLTCTVVAWLPVFARPETVQMALDSWRFLQEKDRLVLYGFVVLENHVHWIASAADLSKEVGDFKSYTARRIIDYLQEHEAASLLQQLRALKLHHKTGQTYQLWQEGAHPKLIRDEEMMRQKLEYIHKNPVRRGYVDDPTHWRCSSARNYAGQPGLLNVPTQW
jgi:REP element-mobilizing transposase RayT